MTHRTTDRLRRWGWAAITGLAILLSGPAPAAEPDWKVGLAQVKITPEWPVPMSGYASRNKLSEGVAADLYVKAMVLEDRDGHRGVIVTSDLLGFPASVAEPICARIEKKTGLKREQVLLNSSHIHTGPSLSLNPADQENPRATRSKSAIGH